MPTKTTEELLTERKAKQAEQERGLAETVAAVATANQQRLDRQQQLQVRVLTAPPMSATATPGDRIARDLSYRDALDRAHAAATTPVRDGDGSGALRTYLDRALRAGDNLAAHAALSAAFEHGYAEVADAYNAAHPGEADAVVELWQLTNRSVSQMMADQLGLVPDPAHIEAAVRQGLIPDPDTDAPARPGPTDPGPWPHHAA